VKRRFSFFILIPLLLASCAKESAKTGCPLETNGDIASLSSATTYEEVTLQESAAQLIERMDNGESIAFLFTRSGCHYCLALQSTFVSFLKDNPYQVALFENGILSSGVYFQEANALKKYFGNTDYDWGATPTLYVGAKGALHYIGDGGLTYQSLVSGFKSVAYLSSITSFQNYSAYLRYLEAHPTAISFLKDSLSGSAAMTFYAETLYPLAKSSAKPLAILNYGQMDSTNQAATLAGFSLTSYAPLIRKGSSTFDLTKESEAAEATSLIQTYYR